MAIVCVLVPVYVCFVHLFMCLNVLCTFVCMCLCAIVSHSKHMDLQGLSDEW